MLLHPVLFIVSFQYSEFILLYIKCTGESVHPFMIGLNYGDARITTKYDENDFRSAIFGTIHECGHAMYEQNIDEKLAGLPLATGTSMGIHESQSLFYENFVGRNEKFWEHNYERLQHFSPAQFGDVAIGDFLRASIW